MPGPSRSACGQSGGSHSENVRHASGRRPSVEVRGTRGRKGLNWHPGSRRVYQTSALTLLAPGTTLPRPENLVDVMSMLQWFRWLRAVTATRSGAARSLFPELGRRHSVRYCAMIPGRPGIFPTATVFPHVTDTCSETLQLYQKQAQSWHQAQRWAVRCWSPKKTRVLFLCGGLSPRTRA